MLMKLPEDQIPAPDYWIMCFPNYSWGEFVYFGTELDAADFFLKRKAWEGGKGWMRKANPDNKHDRELVITEIIAVREDRSKGIRDLPFLPGRQWFDRMASG